MPTATPVAQLASYDAPAPVGGVYTYTLPLQQLDAAGTSTTIDRVVLREDQSKGQRIRTWVRLKRSITSRAERLHLKQMALFASANRWLLQFVV